MAQVYESPVVVSYGELDFEPADLVFCNSLVSCSGQTGNCTTVVTIESD